MSKIKPSIFSVVANSACKDAHLCVYEHVKDRIRPEVHPSMAQMVLYQQMFKGVWFICSVLGHSSQGLRLMGLTKGGQWNVVQGDQSHHGQHQTATSVGLRLGQGKSSDGDHKRIQTGRFKGSWKPTGMR